MTVLERQLETARQLLPPDVLEYYLAGAGDGLTASEAAQAWTRFRIRPKPLRGGRDKRQVPHCSRSDDNLVGTRAKGCLKICESSDATTHREGHG